MSHLEQELVDLCIRLAQFLGLPKSVGEIYGGVLISKTPVSMEEVIQRHGMSKGSTSQGLRQLKQLGAIKSRYIPNNRKEHYVAETGLGTLVAGILRNRFEPGVLDFGERLEEIRRNSTDLNDEHEHLIRKIEKMEQWQEQVEKVVPTLRHVLGAKTE